MGDSMNVYIYPNNPNDDTRALEAKSAIASAINTTAEYISEVEGTPIATNVAIDYSHPGVSESAGVGYTSDKVAAAGQFGTWNTLYNDPEIGAHLLITSSWDGGFASGALGGAWKNRPVAVAGWDKNNATAGVDHFKNICIQEVYHLFIAYANDHELGEVVPGTSASPRPKQTPMVTSYVDEGLDAKGECNRTGNNPGYTTELTICAQTETLTTYQRQGNPLAVIDW